MLAPERISMAAIVAQYLMRWSDACLSVAAYLGIVSKIESIHIKPFTQKLSKETYSYI